MAVAVDPRQPMHHWQSHSLSRQHLQPVQTPPMPQPFPTAEAPLPARNEVDLNRDKLITILGYFSQLLAGQFNRPLRLVVHGGACMLLHPGLYALSQQQHQLSSSLPRRTTTRDVDYIHRSFVREMAQMGDPNAAEKLKECIKATARAFSLGADWMNSDADIALPMATDPSGPSGSQYDPIYAAAIQPNNIDLHTIYRSPNLTLISVTPFWAVSLKLVRYTQNDAADICLLLRNGTILSGAQWTPEVLQNWLLSNCWSMGYANYDAQKKNEMNSRIMHSIQLISTWGATSNHLPQTKVSAHAAMGGGDVIDGEHARNSWGSSIAAGPNGSQGSIQMQSQPPNIRDWLTADPEPKRRSVSIGRPSPVEGNEIFVPPEYNDHQGANPSHAPMTMPHSRGASPNPPVEDRWSSWNHPSQSRVHQILSLNEFDKSLGSMLHEGRGGRNSRSGFIPPTVDQESAAPPPSNRKKEKKKKDKARDRDRRSKWLPRETGNDTDTSDEEVSRPHLNGHHSFHIYAPPAQPSIASQQSLQVPARARSRSHSPSRRAASQERRRPTPLPIEPLKPVPPTIIIPPGGSLPINFQPQVYQPSQASQQQRLARPQHLQHSEQQSQQAPHTQRLARPQHLQHSQHPSQPVHAHHHSHSQQHLQLSNSLGLVR